MSVNTSFPLNSSLPPSPLSPSIYHYDCLNSAVGTLGNIIFAITRILIVLPLCILVLYLGLQRWRQQHSGTTINHSDFFTYHMIIMELISIIGSIVTCFGAYTDLSQMLTAGICLLSLTLSGQMFFHILTCVERYLAVVHPITYLSLRKAKGIRIRNVTICCVWLLCFTWTSLMFIKSSNSIDIIYVCIVAFVLAVISFCSLSVLSVLIRPGPGEGGGSRERVNQSKLRAFYTIMAILGVLMFRFGGNIVATALYDSLHLTEAERCGLWLSVFWFPLPSSLVLPLLFLHRAGKLSCFKSYIESGQGSN